MERMKLPVEEYTTPNPVTAKPLTGIQELLRLMQKNEIRHVPIIESGRVVGIVSERDLKVTLGLSKFEQDLVVAQDVMARDLVTVSSEDSLDEVAFVMVQNKVGSVLVYDSEDNFLGIFTAIDALNALIEVSRSMASTMDADR